MPVKEDFRVGTIFDCGCGDCNYRIRIIRIPTEDKRYYYGRMENRTRKPNKWDEGQWSGLLSDRAMKHATNIIQPGPLSVREIFTRKLMCS